MAFKLTPAEQTQKNDHFVKLSAKSDELLAARDVMNSKVQEAVEEYNGHVQAYNELVNEANGFRSDVASRLQGEYDDKSEKWQESDEAGSAQEFIDAWEGFEIEVLGETSVPELEAEQPNDLDSFEELAEEA
jgi:uncharacterized coiled-coil DUF342 family protein